MTIPSKFSFYWGNSFRQDFYGNFPYNVGSYVKLSSAVAAILVGSLKCRTQFWKGTTQGSFQQSLVEIGSVVSEEKIFFNFIPPFFLFLAWWPSWLEVRITRQHFGRGPSKDHSTKVWLQLAQWFLRGRFLCEFPIWSSYAKLSLAVGAILVERPNRRTQFWKRTIQWLFHQNLVLIEQMVSDKKIFMRISYVKLSSAVVAILVRDLKCRTQFRKGTTQGSFQQSLVEIGSVVSEEKIFKKFHPPLFSIFSLVAILVGSRDHRT